MILGTEKKKTESGSLKTLFSLSIIASNRKTGVTTENGLHISIITCTLLQRNLKSDFQRRPVISSTLIKPFESILLFGSLCLDFKSGWWPILSGCKYIPLLLADIHIYSVFAAAAFLFCSWKRGNSFPYVFWIMINLFYSFLIAFECFKSEYTCMKIKKMG